MVETRQQHTSGNFISGRAFASSEASWVVPSERHATIDKAVTLMLLEGDVRVDDVQTCDNEMEDLLAVDFEVENDWELQGIPCSGAIDV